MSIRRALSPLAPLSRPPFTPTRERGELAIDGRPHGTGGGALSRREGVMGWAGRPRRCRGEGLGRWRAPATPAASVQIRR